MQEDKRPNPDKLLDDILEQQKKVGKLKIFFGYAAGVGKTYSMLDEAREHFGNGVDVLIGYVEPHTRPETTQLLEGLSMLPSKKISYKNIELKEFDLDAALIRKPELILVDGLAHTNANGLRNKKRYQDIEELLNAGINVYTTVNVQHIESLNDIVQDITKITVRETVPDTFFDRADSVKLIDIDPVELLKRFEEGKIYSPDRVAIAINNFFTVENLRLLREIAMRKVADRISHENLNTRRSFAKMANTKLLVCIGPSPSSAKCIRWTARTAEAFHAPWVAVYVENMDSGRFTEQQQKTLRMNMDLAEKLGAEIVTINGDNIATAVAEYAMLSGITNIVIGKSRNKKSFKNVFEMDFEDQLISLLPSLEIHIIPDSNTPRTYRKTRRFHLSSQVQFFWRDALKSIVLLMLATIVSIELRALGIGEQNVIMVYILSVLVISRITIGYLYGIVSSFLSVLAFNFFFTVPYYTFNAIQAGYPVTFFIMLLVALFASALTVRIKTQARLAVERERRTEVLYEINKKLLAARGLDSIVNLTNEYVVKLFKRTVIFYTEDPENGTIGYLKQFSEEIKDDILQSESEKAVAHWVFVNHKPAGAGTDTLMGAKAYYFPVVSQKKILGVMGISCKKNSLDHDDRLFLQMITAQVAMALERQYLSDEQRIILVESEKEKMRSNLLRAISHDLRTPLTAILGASSAILENQASFDESTKNNLIANIIEDSQWLIRMVENLLSVTRIHEGTMNVSKSPEAAEEIVAEAVSRIRKRFPESDISVKVPNELLIVPMDGTLIAQVLINLLENAVKHSQNNTAIDVNVKKNKNYAVIEVIDNGEGIAAEDLPYLFTSFVPNGKKSADSSRGMGIGLSICMSIIKAHQGKMSAENRKSGGAVFRFSLPLS
ncbi:sensor histidine kinase [Bacillus sp. UNC41MFS5]|uniref:sensor histidine kinase n=1 Tax=Bacillus sp. UNC41MFS5 TaxID=1449046 RepID=UPI0018CBFB1F|nr:sensor histidine kinase KdpD [Bacillus sp. UNC41MFS5]